MRTVDKRAYLVLQFTLLMRTNSSYIIKVNVLMLNCHCRQGFGLYDNRTLDNETCQINFKGSKRISLQLFANLVGKALNWAFWRTVMET